MFFFAPKRPAPPRSRRTEPVARLLVAFIFLLALSISGSALAANKPDTVQIGYQKGSILMLVKARGVLDKALEKQGVKIQWIQFVAGPQMLEALNLGRIEFATTGDAPPIFAAAAGAKLTYISRTPASPKTEAIIVPADSPIKSIADLKGKTVALNKGSDVNYFLAAALQKAGLKYSDIKPRYLAPGDAASAFQSGAVDAWAIWDPYYAQAEIKDHARLITDATGIVPHYSFYLAATDFAKKYPGIVKTFNQQVAQVSQWAGQHPDKAAEILAKSTGLSTDVWERAFQREKFGLEPMSQKIYAGQQKIANIFYRIGLIPRKVVVKPAS